MILAGLSHGLNATTVRCLAVIVEAMLCMTGRVTMLGLSRWTESDGSYRTVQRFFNTSIGWSKVHWLTVRQHLLDPGEVLLMAGDEVVVIKSGKKT
jgi:putative transposase